MVWDMMTASIPLQTKKNLKVKKTTIHMLLKPKPTRRRKMRRFKMMGKAVMILMKRTTIQMMHKQNLKLNTKKKKMKVKMVMKVVMIITDD